jgi:hypothetical protein
MKLKSYTIAAFCATFAWSALAQNIVSNGNFLFPGGNNNGIGVGSTFLPGWVVDTTPDSDGLQYAGATTATTFANNNGSPQLQLTGGVTYSVGGGLSQTLATTPGQIYNISIDVAGRSGGKPVGNFNFGGQNTPLPATGATFTTISFQDMATVTNTVIDISGATNSGSVQLVINNVSVVDANLISNGSFTLNPPLAAGATQAELPGSTNIPGWTVDTTPPDGVLVDGGGGFDTAANGGLSPLLVLTDGNGETTGGGVHQTIPTVVGKTYIVSLDVGRYPVGAAAAPGNFAFGSINTPISYPHSQLAQQTFTVVATSTNTLIDITGSTTSGTSQTLISNVIVIASTAVAPTITTQPSPASSTNFSGTSNSISYTVAAAGTAPLSYQWYQNTNTLLPGATNATLALTNLVSSNAGAYSVVVSNVAGSVTSSVVQLALLAGNSNLVQNPGFELPNVATNGSGYAFYSPGDTTDIPNWTVDSASSPDPDGVVLGEAGAFGPNNGTQNLLLSGAVGLTTGGGVSQTIATTPGAVYTVSIQVSAQSGFNGYPAGSPASGKFYFGNEAFTLTGTGTTFTTYFWQVTAEASSTVIDVVGSTNSSVGLIVVDNVYIGATPGFGSKPSITTQPSSVLSGLNGSATFTVATLGLEPFSYQWYYNSNTPIGGATTNPLILNNLQLTNAGSYSVVVSNALGSVTSSVATLTVFSDVNPSFTLNPALASGNTQQIAPGNSTAIPGWIVDTTPPDGVNAGGLGAFVPNNGSPQLELTDGVGETTGGGIHQTIATVPGTIYTVSLDLATTPNGSGVAPPGNFAFGSVNTPLAQATASTTFTLITFTVMATSSSTLVDITGCPNSSVQQLIINNVEIYPTPGNTGVPASIASQPSPAISTNALAGSVTLSATGGGTFPLSYQWQFDGTNIAGATAGSLTLTNIQTTNAGRYSIIITNQFGSATSAVAYVIVPVGPPVILNNPNLTSYAGGVLTLTPIISGLPPFSYEQWYYQSNTLSAESALAGDTNATVTISPTTTNSAGLYSLAVSNTSGAITGLVANLTIAPNLTLNWGFEFPPIPVNSYLSLGPGSTNIANWVVDTSPDSDGVQCFNAYTGAGVPNNGTQTPQLTGGATYSVGGGLSQTINTVAGATYTFSIDVSSRQGNLATGKLIFGANTYSFSVSVNTGSGATPHPFQTITFPVVATGTSTLVDVIGANSTGSVQLWIDNVLVLPSAASPTIAISQATTNIILTYSGGALQSTGVLNGTWTNVTGATSPYTIPHPLQTEQFYRVQ